jgi:hypothetical protein
VIGLGADGIVGLVRRARQASVPTSADIDPCAVCAKPLSLMWRERCEHCKSPTQLARPAPERVQVVFRGVSDADCLRQAEVDGINARASGYSIENQAWSDDDAARILTVVYRRSGPWALAAAPIT